MDFLVLRAFPVFLALGAVMLMGHETRAYRLEGRRDRWLRRSAGSVLLLVLAVMIYFGRIPDRASMTPDQMWAAFRHWITVLVVALGLMALAAWDALAGVRHLRGYFEAVEREELGKIQEHLRDRGL